MENPSLPKYARWEIERRWLVSLDQLPDVRGIVQLDIQDRYLENTRLRLRKTVCEGRSEFKLGKKYGRFDDLQEPVVSTYLSNDEFNLLARLPAVEIAKRRYRLAEGGAIDLYQLGPDVLAVFEIEFRSLSEARMYEPPVFVGEEITGKDDRSGFAIATNKSSQLVEPPGMATN